MNLRLKVQFFLDQKHSNTILEWPERHGILHWCEFAMESWLSLDQKDSNTILEWPERHGMLQWCEFVIESTVFS